MNYNLKSMKKFFRRLVCKIYFLSNRGRLYITPSFMVGSLEEQICAGFPVVYKYEVGVRLHWTQLRTFYVSEKTSTVLASILADGETYCFVFETVTTPITEITCFFFSTILKLIRHILCSFAVYE